MTAPNGRPVAPVQGSPAYYSGFNPTYNAQQLMAPGGLPVPHGRPPGSVPPQPPRVQTPQQPNQLQLRFAKREELKRKIINGLFGDQRQIYKSETGDYTIVCGDRQWRVYEHILRPRWPWFAKTVDARRKGRSSRDTPEWHVVPPSDEQDAGSQDNGGRQSKHGVTEGQDGHMPRNGGHKQRQGVIPTSNNTALSLYSTNRLIPPAPLSPSASDPLEDDPNVITLEDADPDAIAMFLDYLYTQDTELVETVATKNPTGAMQALANLAIVAARYDQQELLVQISFELENLDIKVQGQGNLLKAQPHILARDALLATTILRGARHHYKELQLLQRYVLDFLKHTLQLGKMESGIRALLVDHMKRDIGYAVMLIRYLAGGPLDDSDLVLGEEPTQ